MRKLDMTVVELSEAAGVMPSFLYDIFRGKSRDPSISRLIKVVRVLGISLDDLFETGARKPIVHSEVRKADLSGRLLLPASFAGAEVVIGHVNERELRIRKSSTSPKNQIRGVQRNY